jgi:hypothetical protein
MAIEFLAACCVYIDQGKLCSIIRLEWGGQKNISKHNFEKSFKLLIYGNMQKAICHPVSVLIKRLYLLEGIVILGCT